MTARWQERQASTAGLVKELLRISAEGFDLGLLNAAASADHGNAVQVRIDDLVRRIAVRALQALAAAARGRWLASRDMNMTRSRRRRRAARRAGRWPER